MKIKINGKTVNARKGEYVLNVARREGFEIPTLCHHPALPPDGACRLCLVEAKSASGKQQITTSCTLMVEEGMEVNLDTPEVNKNRRGVLEMLMARVPNSPTLQDLGAKYGMQTVRLKEQDEVCILCGLCARVCTELIGANALTMEGRGVDTYFRPPFGETPESCVGCGSCAFVCPVDCIEYVKTDDTISIWNKDFERLHCEECGRPLDLTKEHAELIKSRNEVLDEKDLLLCDVCSRKRTKDTMQKIVESQTTIEDLWR